MSLVSKLWPLALWSLAGCQGPICGASEGEVSEIVDGDTVVLKDGRKIRYLNVNAPEITGGKSDCFGQEAQARNQALVLGNRVQLRFDDAVCTDAYGRSLAYVSVGGVEVNKALVEEGLACSYTFPPGGVARAEEFDVAESIAQAERRGMWSSCDAIRCQD